MKLLGWMHRKLRQNPSDVFKDFTGGGTCTCLAGRPSLDESPFHNPYDTFLGLSATTFQQSGTEQNLFSDTFLSIGTLGLLTPPFEENDNFDFEVPTFGLPEDQETKETEVPEVVMEEEAMGDKEVVSVMEAIAEKAAEATTESDLMAVTAELEKALTAVAVAEEKDIASCVSSARPSGGLACPLQGFLFGSPVVDHLTMDTDGREKRASLGELFMRTRMAEVAEEGGEELGGDKGAEERSKVAIGLKKMIGLRGGSRGSSCTTDGSKFQKILQIFHRKVYPETSTTNKTKKSSTKNKKTNKDQNVPNNPKSKTRAEMAYGGVNIDNSRDLDVKECLPIFHCCSNRSFVRADDKKISTGDSSGNGEHWIKTDADYLVLEL